LASGYSPEVPNFAGARIAVSAEVGFGCEIADRIIGEVLDRIGAGADRSRGQPVERVVGEDFREIAVAVAAGEHITSTQDNSNH